MARIQERFSTGYDLLFNDLADQRVKNWTFMSDPGLVIIMVAAYIYFVGSAGPKMMAERKPYKLKNIILTYNTFQVIANSLLFYKIYTSGWSTTLTLGCEPVDYSDDPNAVSMAECFWWYLLLKLIELIETVSIKLSWILLAIPKYHMNTPLTVSSATAFYANVWVNCQADSIFFVLRKKQNQISFLHVYHHVSTLGFAWLATKYIAGGMSSFSVMLNTLVHVIMYIYYLLAASGNKKLQMILSKYKKYLTTLQMIQFIIIIIHVLHGVTPMCSGPLKGIMALFLPNVVIVFILFKDFYKKSYKKD